MFHPLTTYDDEVIRNVRREFSGNIRSFQKSLSDHRGDLYTFRRHKGIITSVSYEFNPSF